MRVWTFGRIEGRAQLSPANGRLVAACFSCSISSDKLPDDAFKAEPLQYRNTTSRGSAMCLFSCRPSLARPLIDRTLPAGVDQIADAAKELALDWPR